MLGGSPLNKNENPKIQVLLPTKVESPLKKLWDVGRSDLEGLKFQVGQVPYKRKSNEKTRWV